MKHIITSILLLNCYLLHAQTQLGSDIDGEALGDWSGLSVSMNSVGDRVAIGAIDNNGTGTDAGHVRVYEYSNSSWTQIGSDIDGEAAGDMSGFLASINSAGDRVAIGAPYNNGTGTEAGHVRVYEYSNSSWTQLGSDIDGEAMYDQSGWSVSMNSAGDRVAIGATQQGVRAGYVRVYGLAQSTPNPPTLVINELLGQNVTCCTDANGDYDGYIELYNYGDEEVDIGGMVITDEDDYYQIPANNDSTIILPGGFLLLWADEESEQGVLHLEIELLSRGG